MVINAELKIKLESKLCISHYEFYDKRYDYSFDRFIDLAEMYGISENEYIIINSYTGKSRIGKFVNKSDLSCNECLWFKYANDLLGMDPNFANGCVYMPCSIIAKSKLLSVKRLGISLIQLSKLRSSGNDIVYINVVEC